MIYFCLGVYSVYAVHTFIMFVHIHVHVATVQSIGK